MKVSLVVTTYNWEQALDLVLASVERQRVLPAEVLVADDGSGPATRAVVERWSRRLSVPVRHIWQEDRGFRLSASRNRALAAARGEYILMIDGDMVLHPRFVQSHMRFARGGSYVQGGRVKVRESTSRRLLGGAPVPLNVFTPDLGIRARAIHFPWLSRFHRGRGGPILDTQGCNMAYWLEDAIRVNGFNEDIVGWGYEDIEFAARMQNAGVARRNFKFGGVAFHLHHGGRPADEHLNRQFFEGVMRDAATWCANGVDKYLVPPAASLTHAGPHD